MKDVTDEIRTWYKKGKLHREDGPAVIWPDGSEFWYRYDKFHREDGPAKMRVNGKQEWCYNDKQIKSYQEFQDLTGHSDQYIIYLKLKYGEMK